MEEGNFGEVNAEWGSELERIETQCVCTLTTYLRITLESILSIWYHQATQQTVSILTEQQS